MKSLTFSCRSCGQRIEEETAVCGSTISCPHCRQTVEVPLATTALKMAQVDDDPNTSKRARAPSRFPVRIWFLLLMLVIAGLIGLTSYVYRDDKPRQAVQTDDPPAPKVLPPDQRRIIPRHVVTHKLLEQLNVAFQEREAFPGNTVYQATIDDVIVQLWGPDDSLDAVYVFGHLDGEPDGATAKVLFAVLELLTPNWPRDERSNWFAKAESSDGEVSTTIDGIEVSVTPVVVDDNVRAHTVMFFLFPPFRLR